MELSLQDAVTTGAAFQRALRDAVGTGTPEERQQAMQEASALAALTSKILAIVNAG